MLRPLICRQNELARLTQVVDIATTGKPQLVVLSGPRRVGKTFLLRHLIQAIGPGISAVYFEANQAAEVAQLRRFGEVLAPALDPEDAALLQPFANWEHALNFCAATARTRPLLIVIDEVTYLMGSTTGFASIVQTVWDRIAPLANAPSLVIVLAGSATAMIEDTLSYSGALYQRPTQVIRLSPFTAAEAYSYCGRPEPEALFEAYAACGGYPLHLDAWDFGQSARENLLQLAGSPGGLLLEDAVILLDRLPDPQSRILLAIGQGRSRRSEIANEVGSRLERPLDSCLRTGFVCAIKPIGSPRKARRQYRIADTYLRFWIRILADHVQRIEGGQGEEVISHTHGEWQNQLGSVFEQAAREHAIGLVRSGVLPTGTLIDEWWTTSGEQIQVDVLGLLDHRSVVIGEAKWQKQPLGTSDAAGLWRALRYVPDPIPEPTFILWGRGGVRQDATTSHLLGFGPAEMLAY